MEGRRRGSLEVKETLSTPATQQQMSSGFNVPLSPATMEEGQQQGIGGNMSNSAPSDVREHSDENMSAWQRFMHWLDAYQVQERHPDKVGLMVTFVVLPLAIAYCVIVAIHMMNAPDPVKTEVLWAASEGPFKMPVRCEIASGCLVSNKVGDRNPDCLNLAYRQELDVFIEYSDNFLDGPSVLGLSEASEATGTAPFVTVLSEVWMAGHPNADEDGTVFKWSPVFQGTAMMTYVHTANKTLSRSGRDREEYFNVQVNTDGSLMAGSTPCVGHEKYTADMHQLRLRIHPAITTIEVTPGFSVWTYIGVCSGQYAALISWGALIVATYDTIRGN